MDGSRQYYINVGGFGSVGGAFDMKAFRKVLIGLPLALAFTPPTFIGHAVSRLIASKLYQVVY